MEEADSNLHGWLGGVQNFSAGCNCRCGRNSKRASIRSGAWRCHWIAEISWENLNGWVVASYGWERKLLLETESISDKEVKICGNNKDSEYYITVDKAVAGFGKIDFNF